jgi:hypothetical protein
MIEVITCEQGSPEWFKARLGLPTASEFKTVMAKGEGKTRRAYMLKLLGELLTGESEDSYSNAHMERGKAQEPEARDLYSFHRGVEPELVGFIKSGPKGCSPDSLIGKNGMLEIKTKLSHLQLDVLLANRLPPEHVAQCQGNLWVAEREWIDFCSYRPKLPLFVIRVFRDDTYIRKMAAEVDAFLAEMNELMAKVSEYTIAEAA